MYERKVSRRERCVDVLHQHQRQPSHIHSTNYNRECDSSANTARWRIWTHEVTQRKHTHPHLQNPNSPFKLNVTKGSLLQPRPSILSTVHAACRAIPIYHNPKVRDLRFHACTHREPMRRPCKIPSQSPTPKPSKQRQPRMPPLPTRRVPPEPPASASHHSLLQPRASVAGALEVAQFGFHEWVEPLGGRRPVPACVPRSCRHRRRSRGRRTRRTRSPGSAPPPPSSPTPASAAPPTPCRPGRPSTPAPP